MRVDWGFGIGKCVSLNRFRFSRGTLSWQGRYPKRVRGFLWDGEARPAVKV